TTLGTGE
ncbi:hypothetical protein D030_0590B, partial [Vibrio parahaemolyticus AQ3810]